MTRSAGNDQYYFPERNGLFNTSASALKVDLSAYEGQVVDVIVAAKPKAMYIDENKTDIYLPVAKIDNVGVYGQNGTFYSRIHQVIIDGRTNENLSGDVNAKLVSEVNSHVSDGFLNFADVWNIGYSSAATHTIFETQNVNALNSRYINNELNKIKSGGRVTIDGYVMCKGGVSRYKFSLDGGKTWTVINDTGTNITSGSNLEKNSKHSDVSFKKIRKTKRENR